MAASIKLPSLASLMLPAFIAAALLSSTPASSQPLPGKPSITAAEQAQLRDILDRGVRLYDFDQAAWQTTNTMRDDLPAGQQALVKGWVVTERLDVERVSYFGRDGAKPYLIYSADWDGKQVIGRRVATGHEDLGAQELKLVAALDVATPASANLARCSDARFNTVVLPGKTSADPVSVYFLTPQTITGSYPFGGHYRIDVKDGAIVSQRAFAKSCLEMPVPKGEQPMAMAVTHLLDAIPTEIHVFNVYASGVPVIVMVQDKRMYAIELNSGQANIRLLKPSK